MNIIPFSALAESDLIIDAVYEGRNNGNASDDPISVLLPGVGNMGGFRVSGKGPNKSFVVLYTSGEDKDWPDYFDASIGRFVYYGDNKTPGRGILDTPLGGNKILEHAYAVVHCFKNERKMLPPFFVFLKSPTAQCSRSVQFKGLAVPGAPQLPEIEDLVAAWKTKNNQRFQNYRAVFTILNAPVISRRWLKDLAAGDSLSDNAPKAWANWIGTGRYEPLIPQLIASV